MSIWANEVTAPSLIVSGEQKVQSPPSFSGVPSATLHQQYVDVDGRRIRPASHQGHQEPRCLCDADTGTAYGSGAADEDAGHGGGIQTTEIGVTNASGTGGITIGHQQQPHDVESNRASGPPFKLSLDHNFGRLGAVSRTYLRRFGTLFTRTGGNRTPSERVDDYESRPSNLTPHICDENENENDNGGGDQTYCDIEVANHQNNFIIINNKQAAAASVASVSGVGSMCCDNKTIIGDNGTLNCHNCNNCMNSFKHRCVNVNVNVNACDNSGHSADLMLTSDSVNLNTIGRQDHQRTATITATTTAAIAAVAASTASTVSSAAMAAASVTNLTDGKPSSAGLNTFQLPRAMLKHGSIAGNISNGGDSGFVRCYEKSNSGGGGGGGVVGGSSSSNNGGGGGVGVREQRVSLSHYSTDKSGSSGYYSSNLYSTCSVDEHIYSEPVIELVHVPPAGVGGQQKQQQLLDKKQQQSIAAMCVPIVECQTLNDVDKMTCNLVDTMGRCPKSAVAVANLVNSRLRESGAIQGASVGGVGNILCDCVYTESGSPSSDYAKRKCLARLPTIMEGITDGQIPRPIWPLDFDDSLVDLNLDSFLLANELASSTAINDAATKIKGIANGGGGGVGYGTNGSEENNYRCTKYVNSCPENPYCVEDVLEDCEQRDKSLSYYLSKCKPGSTVPTTRDFLEEMRTKLSTLLEQRATQADMYSVISTPTPVNNPFTIESVDGSVKAPEANLLEENIKQLKSDVDEYLRVMTLNSELEIKQLCTGMSKNSTIITMKNALANRRRSESSLADDGYEVFDKIDGYEPMMAPRKGTMSQYGDPIGVSTSPPFDIVYVHNGFNMDYNRLISDQTNPFAKVGTLRSSDTGGVDSNFHLKRKTPVADLYLSPDDIKRTTSSSRSSGSGSSPCTGFSSSEESASGSGAGTGTDRTLSQTAKFTQSQMQQNLALHRPSLLSSLGKSLNSGEKDMILEWHRNKPSIWEQYYGTNRPSQTLVKKFKAGRKNVTTIVSYPSTRPESDFTLDLPRAEQLRIKMQKEKQFRSRCRMFTTFLSLVFFLLTVMVVSLILTRGKRMFGSML